jgi:uncharacterized small protein (DUF1192 family)
MSSCGCNKQGGGGSKRCSCKKCRRYSQMGGGFFGDFFGSTNQTSTTPTTPTTPTTQRQSENLIQNSIQSETIDEKKERIDALQAEIIALQAEINAKSGISGGGWGNKMSRAVYGGYWELVTAQNEANIELDSGPSIATQGLVSQAGGKRKTHKTHRMKKSRKHKKSRKYRR